MSGLAFLIPALALVSAPAVSWRVVRDWEPMHATRVQSASMVGGLTLLDTALLICGAPIVVSGLGLHPIGRVGVDHFFPGGAWVGWLALSLGVLLPVSVAWTLVKVVRRRADIARDLLLAGKLTRVSPPVVVLPIDRFEAFAVPGRSPVVAVSRSVDRELERPEFELLLRHEVAHVDLHSRFLLLASALEPLGRGFPALARGTAALRLSLERWADDVAATALGDRATIRRLLLRVGSGQLAAGTAAIGRSDNIQARLAALEYVRERQPVTAWLMVGALVILAVCGAAILINWII